MKIVDRQTFLALPAGTVFMKFPAQPENEKYINLAFDEKIEIKNDTVGNDFYVSGLFPDFEGVGDSKDWSKVMISMIKGEIAPPADYDAIVRDGLYDDHQLFAVWSKQDLERMIARLQEALSTGYPT